jgi:hypothetical protein
MTESITLPTQGDGNTAADASTARAHGSDNSACTLGPLAFRWCWLAGTCHSRRAARWLAPHPRDLAGRRERVAGGHRARPPPGTLSIPILAYAFRLTRRRRVQRTRSACRWLGLCERRSV